VLRRVIFIRADDALAEALDREVERRRAGGFRVSMADVARAILREALAPPRRPR
jgi:hypothetical protein